MGITPIEGFDPPPLALIANDQEWAARSLESVLGPQGFATVRAFTGRQALDFLRNSRADAVILDVGLPDLSGIEVCRILSETPSHRGLPIILLTSGVPTRAQKLDAFRAGAWELLSEPLDVEALVLKLELYVRAKRESDRLVDSGLLDSATGLYNSRGLAMRAREIGADAARRHGALSCIAFSLSVDGPTPSGGVAGIDVEAALVQRLGEVCRQSARRSDAIGRLGRAELVIITPGTDGEGARRIAERVRLLAESTPVTLGAQSQNVRLTTGIVTIPDFSESPADAVSVVLRAASELRSARVVASGRLQAIEAAS
ncbi:MAG: GGDEF domain-containing response regulator [Gemmatimonadota bacterium]